MLLPQPIFVITMDTEVKLNKDSGDTNCVGREFNTDVVTCLVPVYLQYSNLQASTFACDLIKLQYIRDIILPDNCKRPLHVGSHNSFDVQ